MFFHSSYRITLNYNYLNSIKKELKKIWNKVIKIIEKKLGIKGIKGIKKKKII